MKKLFFILSLCIGAFLCAQNESGMVGEYAAKIEAIDKMDRGNIWLTRHENYDAYKKRRAELEITLEEIKKIRLKKDSVSTARLDELERKRDALESHIEQLSEFQNAPYSGLLKSPDVPPVPSVSNPFAIFAGFSYIKRIRQDLEGYQKQVTELETLLQDLKEKEELQERIFWLDSQNSLARSLEQTKILIQEFNSAYDIVLTSSSVYERKIEESVKKASNAIKDEVKHTLYIVTIIASIVLISFLLKFLIKSVMSANERSYIINKVINIVNVTLIILILLFAYIENMTYLVAVLGFASAGIAIAMKDMFMNILGWTVITFGRSFSVGDRVKVTQNGVSYVGDIVDISLMRMTILEDVTLTTYLENKRAGRVIFIPNNFIFTTLISNYTHETLKTVWDGIYITISFDSNYKKAMYIIKEIVKKYSKGYTEIARKQLNQLRQRYNLKNTNVEPKIFSFIEPHGLTIHVWYMTNSYAALALRSTLSGEIIDAVNKEDDIMIAYPTQTLNLKSAEKLPPKTEASGQ
ncbi:MAG: mechanosensitive ion channel [Campylobacteraceae bacterium]|jgi:small-conductance mechanosensitive channel|nr:mechanosensitive ion channel [Campylobacteraceae bacterium]